MSVLVVAKLSGDVATFQKALSERAEEFGAFAARARDVGCVHHRFGVGDGYVLVVDEWDSAESFQTFFSEPDLQAFVASVGGDVSAQPELLITDAVSSVDEF